MTKPGALPFDEKYQQGVDDAPHTREERNDTLARLVHVLGELAPETPDIDHIISMILRRPDLLILIRQMVDEAVANRPCDLHLERTTIVHRTFNWLGALIGAVVGVVVGLIVNYFLNPTTVLNLLPGGGELLFSAAVDQLWFQLLVVIVGVLIFGILGGFIFSRRTELIVLTDTAARSRRSDNRRSV